MSKIITIILGSKAGKKTIYVLKKTGIILNFKFHKNSEILTDFCQKFLKD